MDAERIAEIRGRLEKATPGPWRALGWNATADPDNLSARVMFPEEYAADHKPAFVAECNGNGTKFEQDDRNAAFIAACRQDVPDLLAALDEANDTIARFAVDEECFRLGQESERAALLTDIRCILCNGDTVWKGTAGLLERLEAAVTARGRAAALPMDAHRERSMRYREALRRICDAGPAGHIAGSMADCVRIAREALRQEEREDVTS